MQFARFFAFSLASALAGCGSASTSSSADPSPSTTPTSVPSGAPAPTGTYAPKGIDIGTNRIAELHFADAQNGFLLLAGQAPNVRGVWATTDGGDTWAKREIDIVPGGMAFTPDMSELWVVGTSSVSAVWTSADRGQSFAPLTWTEDSPGRVAFVDAQTVLVPDYLGTSIYRSTDAGATWSAHELDGTDAASHLAVLGQDVWLAGGASFLRDGAIVTHSTDGGATWSSTNLADDAHTFEGGQLNALAAVSATDVWVAGDNRQLFHTMDGATWTQIKGIPESFDQFGGLAVSGSRVLVAGNSANGYALYESTDSGATFQAAEEIRCPSACGQVTGIASPSPNVFFVYGDGLLWRVTR